MSDSFKILIVDDQPFARDGLTKQLNWERFHGVLCGSVSNGLDAMDFLQSCRPDAIITDIKMPHMDGIELARQVHESPVLSGIPVILLSAYQEFEYAQSAMAYHVNHYIIKPMTRQKIEQLENILIELYHAREASRTNLTTLTNGNHIRELSAALRRHDISKIEDYFQSSIYRGLMNREFCDILGSQLLGVLYDYLNDIHFEPKTLETSRAHTLETFYELPGAVLKSNYVETIYMDFLTLVLQKKSSNANALYRYAIQYVDDNYTDINFSISNMASEMNITLSYLSTIFKQFSGQNLNTYVTEKRISHSRELLKTSHYSIREVALLSGYADDGYFSSLFRKKIGMTPTEYRNCQI